jgi:hypothetical protein
MNFEMRDDVLWMSCLDEYLFIANSNSFKAVSYLFLLCTIAGSF